jgi:hypothetical protein
MKRLLTGTGLRALPFNPVKPVAGLREINALLLRASAFPDRRDDYYLKAAELVEKLSYQTLIDGVDDLSKLPYDLTREVEKIKTSFIDALLDVRYTPTEAVLRARGMDKRVHNAIEDAKHSIEQAKETEKARREGWVLIWVPERDACAYCRTVAGQIIRPGEKFTAGKGAKERSVLFPPAHPNCRCKQQAVQVNNQTELSRLQREVHRILAQAKPLSESKSAIYTVVKKIVKPVPKPTTTTIKALKPITLKPLRSKSLTPRHALTRQAELVIKQLGKNTRVLR